MKRTYETNSDKQRAKRKRDRERGVVYDSYSRQRAYHARTMTAYPDIDGIAPAFCVDCGIFLNDNAVPCGLGRALYGPPLNWSCRCASCREKAIAAL